MYIKYKSLSDMVHLLIGLESNLQAYFKMSLNKYNLKLLIRNTDNFTHKHFDNLELN